MPNTVSTFFASRSNTAPRSPAMLFRAAVAPGTAGAAPCSKPMLTRRLSSPAVECPELRRELRRLRPVHTRLGRLAGVLPQRTTAPFPGHAISATIPPSSSSGVPYVMDPYSVLHKMFGYFTMDSLVAGWSSLAARRAHNPKVAGSNPAPATTFVITLWKSRYNNSLQENSPARRTRDGAFSLESLENGGG